MELRDLELFVTVTEAGGFRKAAGHLCIPQSVVSRRIRNLEDELGVSVFERHRAGVRLTHAGDRLLRHARTILAQVQVTIRSIGAEGLATEGALCIGLTTSLSTDFFHDLLERWIATHPSVYLDFVEGSPREHIGAIVARRMDLTFVTGPNATVGCDSEVLWREEIIAAIPAEHWQAEATTLTLSDLREERFLVSRASPGPEIYECIIQELSGIYRPRIDILAVGRDSLLALVGLKLGITLVSSSAAGTSYPNVRFVPINKAALEFSAVWSPSNDNPALRRFLSDARILSRERKGAASEPPDRSP